MLHRSLVSYEDLGLNLKITPVVHGNGEVSLKIELQVRSLTGQSSNGVPVISNREYQGSIRLRDGEPAVIAGQISTSDQRSLSGIPGCGSQFPGLNQAMVDNTLMKAEGRTADRHHPPCGSQLRSQHRRDLDHNEVAKLLLSPVCRRTPPNFSKCQPEPGSHCQCSCH